MQPSGAQGAHNFLVRPGDVQRKRKKEKNEAGHISGILSGLAFGFLLQRPGMRVLLTTSARSLPWSLPPHSKIKRTAE
jgi:hypothetical protein